MEVTKMLFSKSIKKLILISLLAGVSAETMPISWPSFSSIKRTTGQLVATIKKTIQNNKIITIAVGGSLAVYLGKIYRNWQESQIKIKKSKKIEENNRTIADRCCICFEESTDDNRLEEVRCDKIHPDKIHQSCLDKTLDATKDKCPVCLSIVPYFGFNMPGFTRRQGQGLYWRIRKIQKTKEEIRELEEKRLAVMERNGQL
ncbi:MAG: hypothetical protein WCD44_00495 [Candidatus Babeliales bacterium]